MAVKIKNGIAKLASSKSPKMKPQVSGEAIQLSAKAIELKRSVPPL